MADPTGLAEGRTAEVRVPATSANLGPGFDSLGLAVGLADHYSVRHSVVPGVRVSVAGEGADELPSDADHLVAAALCRGLRAAGATWTGLELHCRNGIPHRRGLGSSAAAIVGGLVAARELLGADRLPVERILDLATELEGHPDNVAAALLGGFTIAWTDTAGPTTRAHAAVAAVHPDVRPVVAIPGHDLPTTTARGLLPEAVPHADAAFNAGRAALLVHALGRDPSLLFAATEDRLHQRQRGPAMPESLALVRALRDSGLPAVVSGAGPAVLVLASPDTAGRAAALIGRGPFQAIVTEIDHDGARAVAG
ncbi:MAG: homoserine kinase [Actinomycetota bacterium]|nr:MAG: homoserine kinase [Actinomycetota bacterium]